jgi:hypothetical protein
MCLCIAPKYPNAVGALVDHSRLGVWHGGCRPFDLSAVQACRVMRGEASWVQVDGRNARVEVAM